MEAQRSETAQWLTSVVVGAQGAGVVANPDDSISLMGPNGEVCYVNHLRQIRETSRFKLYPCLLPSGRRGILKIASTSANNVALDREAVTLNEMNQRAMEIDSGLKADEHPYQYYNFLPQIEASFKSQEQSGRWVNALSFTLYDEIADENDERLLLPLGFLWEKQGVRVDPKTATWIFGKSLKVLAFAHDLGIAVGDATENNILISPTQHGVVFFDWTMATRSPACDFVTQAAIEVSQLAKSVIKALGGDLGTGELPKSDQLPDNRFQRFLWRLAKMTKVESAYDEHEAFYKLIYELWPRGFHPYTTLPLEEA